MSRKNKLERFAENKTFPNLFEYSYERIMSEGFPLQGKWHADFFHNDNPIVLELGCGKGEYTLAMAKRFPGRNYIGIDPTLSSLENIDEVEEVTYEVLRLNAGVVCEL